MNDEKDMQAFETAMRWNGFNPPERSVWNGGIGYTSARDADRYRGWCMAQEAAAEELKRLQAIEAAARNLVKVKGRYHTEQAFKALAALLVNVPVEPACPVCNRPPVFERDRRVAEWAGHCKHCAVEGPAAATEAEARRLWIVWHHKRSDAQSVLVNTEVDRASGSGRTQS